MNCTKAKPQLSLYLDGNLTGREMLELQTHLGRCAGCSREYELLKQTQSLTAKLPRRRAPVQLALQLKLAASRQTAQAQRQFLSGFLIRVQDAGRAVLMPAAAGMLSAFVFFGLLIGFFALPPQVQANDVPTMLYTPPQLRWSPVEVGIGASNGDAIVIEAYIDPSGRVQDYRVLTGPKDISAYLPQLNNALIFTRFRPATNFGRPTAGKVVFSFAKISVRG
jgi:anti-sigma factor RsiW